MIFPDFINFSPEQCLNQFVYHIYLNQVPPSCLFIKAVPNDLYVPKLNSLCDTLNADDSTHQYTKWILFSIISRLSMENKNQNKDNTLNNENFSTQLQMKKPNIPDSFYLLSFDSKAVKSKEATVLLQIFTGKSDFFLKTKPSSNPKQQNADDLKNVIQAILYLFEKHRGLYSALLRHGYIEALLMRIGPEPIFNIFKLNSFSLREQFDNSYLPFFSIKLINSSNFGQFWNQYPILFDTKASQLFQSLFACNNPFPYDSTKYFPEDILNDSILSLTNDVLTKRNKTFIDIILIIRTLIYNGLETTKDQEFLLTYTKQFPDLRIIAFLSEYESIKNETFFDNVVFQITSHIESESNSISQIDQNSIMIDIIQRFGNDYSLCFFLTNNIGRKTRSFDLEKVSLPKYLIEHANFEIDLSNFIDKKMFVINDDDRKSDFTFIYAYQAICLIMNQIEHLKSNESQTDLFEMSTISLNESLSEASLSSTEINSIFSNNLNKHIEIIKKLTDDEFFEKLMIEFYSILFISEKSRKSKKEDEEEDEHEFVFSDDKITEIVSILFHFCPKQKEIRKAFSRFKFIKTFSEKKFEEAKNLAENDDDPLYKLTVLAELVSKVSNSEQWTFPSCIDKPLFDAEFLLSNNEDFGSSMAGKLSELNILVGKRRLFKKSKKYMPYLLYDVENTRKNIDALYSFNFGQIERDKGCIQFNDFIDFELKLEKSGSKNLSGIDDIISFEIKNNKTASLLTLKTVPEEYKDNKLIKAIFDITAGSSQKKQLIDLNAELQTLDDISNYLRKSEERLFSIQKADIEIILSKSLSFDPLPYDILNELYLRDTETVSAFYQKCVDKFKLRDFTQIMPFCFSDYFTSVPNVDGNMCLVDFLQFLVSRKKFNQVKKLASDFSLTKELDSILENNVSKETSQIIEITFPHLREMVLKKFPSTEKVESTLCAEDELMIDQLRSFMEVDEENGYYPTFSGLFPLFEYIKFNFESISTPLMSEIVDVVTVLLSSSSVDSFEVEMNAMTAIPRLLNNMKLFKLKMANISDASNYQTFLSQLDCLSRFVGCCFNGSYGEVYSFDDFFSKQQGASYASLCQKYDQVEILRDIQTSWGLFEFRFFDSALNCIKLGLLKRGNIELREAFKAHQALKIDCQCLAAELIPNLSFVRPISASTFIDEVKHMNDNRQIDKISETDVCHVNYSKMIKEESGIEINNNQEKFFRSLRKADGNDSELDDKEGFQLPTFHLTSPQIITLDESLSIIGAAEDRILFHCQFGDLDEAFILFNQSFIKNASSLSSGVRLSVFLRVLITPAIAFKQWNGFWRKMVKYLTSFGSVIDDFLNYVEKNRMFLILYDVLKRLEYNDKANLAAIRLFETAESWKNQQDLLNNMSQLIKKSLSLNNPEQRKTHKAFFSFDSLFQLQRRVNVQLAIISMFIHTNVPFDKKLEIMTSKENTLNLASFLLLKFQIGYFFEICELPDISIEEVCECTIEKLNSQREEGNSLSGFFKNITRLEPGTYRKIILCLSKSIYRRAPDEKTFIEFVTRNIKGDDLIASVLQSFGFENEADEILKRKSHK